MFSRIVGSPAERSLLSRIVQGSKSFRPIRLRVRTSGSTVSELPSGSGTGVGAVIVSSRVPSRTFSPAWWKISISRATFIR